MADDPFAALDARMQTGVAPSMPTAPPTAPTETDPFAAMDDRMQRGEPLPQRTGALEAAGVHAATGVVPAAGVIGGAELGAEAGGVVGGPVGAVLGGLAGGWFGGYAGSKAQDTALQAMPDRWRDPLENEQAISETEHPYASMLGGFAPYMLTLSPLNAARGALPANATAWQKIAASPWIARTFGGVLQGGAELTQEYANHETPDWAKVGIATGFGFVFNRPNRIGEAITRGIRAPFEGLRPEEPAATIANADANNVAGPGVTEAVATGELKRNEAAEQAAQEAARVEASIIAPPKPDVNEIVSRLRPDLVARRDELEGHIGGFQSIIREAHERAALEGAEIPDLAAERQHISALNEELRGVQTELAAVYRHAAEATGSETVPKPEPAAETRAAQEEIAAAKPAEATEAAAPGEAPATPTAVAHLAGVPAVAAESEAAKPLGEQKRFIADDVAQRMIAVGWDADIAKENGIRLANYWSVHAARLNGAEGTAEQLYLKERTEYAPPPAKGKVGKPPEETDASAKAERLGYTKVIRALDEGGASTKEIAGVIGGGMTAKEVASVIKTTRRESEKPRAETLHAFLKRKGGIQDQSGELSHIGLVKGYPGLVNNRTGRTLDYAREMAAEAGYLGPDKDRAMAETTVDDLLEALKRKGVYSVDDQAELQRVADAAQRNSYLDQIEEKQRDIEHWLAERDEKPIDREWLELAADLLHSGEVADIDTAVEKAAIQLYEKEVEAKHVREGQENLAEHPGGAAEAAPRGAEGSAANAPSAVRTAGAFTDEEVDFLQRRGLSSDDIERLRAQRDIFGELHRQQAEAKALVDTALKQERPRLVLEKGDDRLVLSKGLGEYPLRITTFDKDGPVGHRDYKTTDREGVYSMDQEIYGALRHGYTVEGQPKTEAGPEGTRQTLIAGVAPITERDKLEFLARQPLRARAAQKAPTGLFGDEDLRKQGELFGPQGSIRIRPGERSIITRLEGADASTIVHEEAHDWLDRMMRDSFHEQASGELRDDAQAVADWLKINRGESISRKAHEKFARAWERYTWEGVAPSHALARIFEKFTGWLRAIYNSVRDIPGAPEIPPEIRAVFDRMLTDRNENIVIADHVEGRPTFDDIHVADAQQATPGPAADAVGDQIVAEATRREQEHEPAREIIERAAAETAEHAGEATERPNETGLLAEGGGGPEPNAEQRGGGGGTGEELGRGGAGVQQGAPAGGTAEPRSMARQPSRSAGGAIPHPEPRDEFGPDTRDVDKAGNINLDRIAAPEDVKRIIRAAAEANNDFIGDRRGVVTWGETVQLAEALGMDASGLLQRKIGQAFNASEAWAARKLLVQSAHSTHDAMRAAADGDETALLAYVHARERHKLIQAQVAGLTAEAGRALNIFRKVAGGEGGDVAQAVDKIIRDGAGITLDQARKEAKLGAALETPEQVSEFMNATRKPGFGDMLLEYWINGLISGPTTHITYSIANELLSLTRAAPETAVAAMIGQIRASMGREGTRVLAGEVARRLETMVGTGARAGAQAAAESFKAGTTLRLPGEKGTIGTPMAGGGDAPLATAPTLEPHAFGAVRGLKEGFVTASTLGAIPGPLGTIARLPSRAIAGIHSFFRVSNYLMEINALAYRQAMEEGLSGVQRDSRIEELKRNPTPEMMEAARATATNATLMGPAGLFTQKLQQLVNTPIELPGVGPIRLLRFIDPFVQISSNIIKEGLLARTPVGLLSKTLRDDLMGKNGNIAADMAASRMLCGTALAAMSVILASQGYVNGSGPGDRKLAAVWREAGNLPHSVRIGDMWYAMNRLGPLGLLMGVSADLYDVATKAEENEWLKAGSILQEAFTHNILDESFLRGPSDLIKAMTDANARERWLANMGTSFLPFSVGMAQLARGADPFSRQARSFMDQVKMKTPGLSETLLPRISIWGAPIPAYDALIHSGVTAIYEQRQNTDPVDLTLLKLGIGIAMPPRTIRGVQLTDQQWTDFAMLSGRMLKGRLDRLIVSRDFQHSPVNTQADLIRAAVDANREVARGWMLARYPQILQAGYRNKIQIQRRGTN